MPLTNPIMLDDGVEGNLVFSAQEDHAIFVDASTDADTRGGFISITGGVGTGTADGGTIDLFGGSPSGTGNYGSVGVGRQYTHIITIGDDPTSATRATFQTFLRGDNVFVTGNSSLSIQTLNRTGGPTGGDIVVNSAANVIFRSVSTNVFVADNTGVITIGGSFSNTGQIAIKTNRDIQLYAGNAVTSGDAGGNLLLEGGQGAGAGAAGTVQIGISGSTTSDIEIGHIGTDKVTINGPLYLNAAIVDQHIQFKKGDGSNHSLYCPATTTTNGNGAHINVLAGDANGNGDGGYLTLDSGATTSGHSFVYIGNTNAVEVSIGRTGKKVGFLGNAPVLQQTSGSDLTNNVTSGGTSDTIDNWTDLTLYVNDAAAIRNAVYQLARKVKQINDGLRLYGLLS